MIKPPYTKWINDIKTKLGFNRTMTASGADVVDAVNKQSSAIGNVESSIAIIVDGDTASQEVPTGSYAYIKNNTHGLSEGLYINNSNSAFPIFGGTANSDIFTSAYNALNRFDIIAGVSVSTGFVSINFNRTYKDKPLVIVGFDGATTTTAIIPKIADLTKSGCKIAMLSTSNNYLGFVAFYLFVVERM